MEKEEPSLPSATPAATSAEPVLAPGPQEPAAAEEPYRGLRWIFIGSQGLRAGWSVLVFLILFVALNTAFDTAIFLAHLVGTPDEFTPGPQFFAEAGSLLALLIAAAIMGLIEGRRIPAYNLTGPRRTQHFFFGLAAGFLALSALVGALAAGGWLHFGPASLTGAAIFRFALLWGCVFLVGAASEEGLFRCYGLFTLARGINFWWALALVSGICVYLIVRPRGNGAWGVFAFALVGLIPCLVLHLKKAESASFWQAAWAASTFFGFGHTSNNGENWIGIFAAALIGFVFCVSVKVTGSAWWAIGCHAAWDWGETFFYGTADSGFKAQGHYLTTTPAGATLWSGGMDGPEGSVLVVPVVLLLLTALALLYGRRRSTALNKDAAAT